MMLFSSPVMRQQRIGDHDYDYDYDYDYDDDYDQEVRGDRLASELSTRDVADKDDDARDASGNKLGVTWRIDIERDQLDSLQ